MTYRPEPSIFVLLAQTLFITVGGFLLVSLLAQASTMSRGELLIGPLSIGFLWLGMGAKTGHRTASDSD